jgi:putative endonuclease
MAGTKMKAGLRLRQWVLGRLDAVASRRSGGPEHLKTGVRGEQQALLHLRGLGYVVVAQRWKTPRLRGDVDLIAWDGDCLCFIEVKTRAQRDPMYPAELAVDEEKRRMLRRMAGAYLKGLRRGRRAEPKARFDLLLVYLKTTGLKTTGLETSGFEASGTEFEVRKGAIAWE